MLYYNVKKRDDFNYSGNFHDCMLLPLREPDTIFVFVEN
jgi:hypothetical protein